MTTAETRAAVERFHQAVNSNDAAAVAAAMTEDCVFESTPPPDGERLQGTAEVAGFFQKLFDTAARRTFDIEELIISGDRAALSANGCRCHPALILRPSSWPGSAVRRRHDPGVVTRARPGVMGVACFRCTPQTSRNSRNVARRPAIGTDGTARLVPPSGVISIRAWPGGGRFRRWRRASVGTSSAA